MGTAIFCEVESVLREYVGTTEDLSENIRASPENGASEQRISACLAALWGKLF